MSTSSCCSAALLDSSIDDADDILLIGLQGSGKTLLAQRLRTIHGKQSTPPRVATTETNGSQDFRVPTSKSCPFKEIRIRECGGSMQPLWKNWYSRSLRCVVFTVDASDPSTLAASGVELYRLLQEPDLSMKPICLVLTKADLPVIISRPELDLALGLADLERLHRRRLFVFTLSSVQTPQECPALEGLLDWMTDVKARDLGLTLPPGKKK